MHAVTPARSFALRLIAWSLALFGLQRLPWVGLHILLPATQLQAAAGSALLGPSSLPIEATLACSGADALALCLAAILAYPARWRMRAAGIAGGTSVLLVLNTIRIGTLGRAVASPRLFDALHVYVWPAVLTLAIAGFVFTWMRAADRPFDLRRSLRAGRAKAVERPWPERAARVEGRFAVVTAICLLVFTLASPLYLESARVLVLAGMVAHAAAFLLRAVGVDATATASALATPGGAFLVTQECISTPLIPVYFAAVLVYSRTWWARALWTAAGVPLFVGLGIARLLVVAVPGLNTSPAFFIHAFSQLLVAAGMVCAVALWRHGARATTYARALFAMALAVAFVRWVGTPYTHAILWFSPAATAFDDPQGALMFLPAFQFGLFLALWVAAFVPSGWTTLACGASLLATIQIVVAGGVQLLASHAGIAPLVRDIRAWALLGPALIIAAVVNVRRHTMTALTAPAVERHLAAQPTGVADRRTDVQQRDVTYRAFWHDVGAQFPDLGGAASTTLYFENEKRLLRQHLRTFAGKRVLKTDLWDEARNTRILQWVQRQGANVVGVDISTPVVRMAGAGFTDAPLTAANADVRALPFADASFDAVYSMGTIEHFPGTEGAVREIYRVLKPGGRAIIGVPNRHDPFLRPLMVTILYHLGLYGYGFEKSYSRRTLRHMLEAAGFAITADDGILFIPGWLRMLDLLCHTRYPSAARLTAKGVRVFGWIDAHVPAVRRHGYLVVAIGERPAETTRKA